MPTWNSIAEDPNLWRGLAIGFICGLAAAKPLWMRFKKAVRELDDKLNTNYETISE